MNELKHELVELLNKHDLTISEFDELISFMQRIKGKAKLTFEEYDNSHGIIMHPYIEGLHSEKSSITLL